MNNDETTDFEKIAGSPMKGIAATLLALLTACNASAWMDKWAPEFKSTPVDVQKLPMSSVSNFVSAVRDDFDEYRRYCEGYRLDLNGDGTEDQVFILPWMGCGLGAAGYEAHFIVSNGANGKMHTVIDGYGVSAFDFVKVAGKTYFRHSDFFNRFENSNHNHWVFQVFSFDTNGVMRCGNDDFGKMFPAATIFYSNPRFKRVELTKDDLKEIADKTKPTLRPQ